MAWTSEPTSPAESRVLIIMTGGTICMKQSTDGLIPSRGFLQAGMEPRPSFNDGSKPDDVEVVIDDGTTKHYQSLRTPVSRYSKHVRYAVFEFEELLDSSSINAFDLKKPMLIPRPPLADGWSHIASTIYRNYIHFDAFVVLHGTDSLAYTCSALSFMLQNLGKPVILTGSQAPMMELQNDATDNMLGSLIIAGHFMIPEVCLFFNYKLFRGNRTTKASASDFAAFSSPNFPPLATISSMKTHVSWDLIDRPTDMERFSIHTSQATGDVACLRIFPGIRPDMVEAVLQIKGLKGLVLETFGEYEVENITSSSKFHFSSACLEASRFTISGAGNAPEGPDGALIRIFTEAVKRGIVIVNVTQCMTGTVSPLYAPAMLLNRAGVIPGHDMTTEAALAKLSYLLSLPNLDTPAIIQQMSVPLRGEFTEQTNMIFEHPQGTLPMRVENLTRLGYAISNGNTTEVQEMLTGNLGWLLNEADYSGNTPLHIAAAGPNVDILRMLLTNGASVHLRNRAGRTPLFVAALAQLADHVAVLKQAGAHLSAEELAAARLQAKTAPNIWHVAIG
ncbi:hypothetical protein ACLMJK_001233 [Lecanora helva]